MVVAMRGTLQQLLPCRCLIPDPDPDPDPGPEDLESARKSAENPLEFP